MIIRQLTLQAKPDYRIAFKHLIESSQPTPWKTRLNESYLFLTQKPRNCNHHTAYLKWLKN